MTNKMNFLQAKLFTDRLHFLNEPRQYGVPLQVEHLVGIAGPELVVKHDGSGRRDATHRAGVRTARASRPPMDQEHRHRITTADNSESNAATRHVHEPIVWQRPMR